MKNKKNVVFISIGVVVIAIILFLTINNHDGTPSSTTTSDATVPTKTATTPPIVKSENAEATDYTTLTLTTADPVTEIAAIVGASNVPNILRLNRINSTFLKAGSTVVIPKDPADFNSLSPFPTELPNATAIPKLMMVSQRVEAFGLYENGKLVRWGPVSTGKQSTQTASKLYFTNWKGKEVHSSFSDEWVLKWNFNLDNAEGIGMHQYEMPGYPASHSCVRMFGTDAEWIYNWADQWIVSDDQQTVLAHGIPVLVFGTYAYGKTAPWKNLPKDAAATTLTESELSKALAPELSTIAQRQQERIDYLKNR
ncbi:MAG: L,D-transpeptidase [Candidatus Paceibacterota bacterium]